MIKDRNALPTGSEPVKRYEWTKTNVFLIEKAGIEPATAAIAAYNLWKMIQGKEKTQNL